MLSLLREFAPPAEAAQLHQRLQTWYHECDPAMPLHKKLQLNSMHVLGAKLCCDLDQMELPGYHTYDVVATFSAIAPMPFDEPLLSRLGWQQLTDMMTTVQLEYRKLLAWDDVDGWATRFDYCCFILFALKRAGYWLRHSWKTEGLEADVEATQGAVTLDDAGWRTLAPSTVAHLLDAMHSFGALTNRLLSATVVRVPDAATLVEMHSHHREASLDEYYVNAMVGDLPVGSILQYAHRFQFLFHSITQVVYFHWPSYKRLGQKPLAELRLSGTAPSNLLPLLLQIDPELPVLNEHTRALCHTHVTTAAAPWAWLNVSGFFALAHLDGSVYVAKDVRELFAHYQTHKRGQSCG